MWTAKSLWKKNSLKPKCMSEIVIKCFWNCPKSGGRQTKKHEKLFFIYKFLILNFNKCSWTVITNTLNSEWQINEMVKEIQLNNVITGNNYAITKARFIRANFSFKHTVSWGKNFSSCFRYQKKIINISMKSLKLFLKTLPEQYEIFKLL